MKKILMALLMIGFSYSGAEAQNVACGKPEGKVCTKKGCYKTPYAENFKVCKSANGYFICCEEPNTTNSTFPKLNIAGNSSYRTEEDTYAMQSSSDQDQPNQVIDDSRIPQSQSYPKYSANAATSYTGNYAKKKIRVCSNTDNVAEQNRQAYSGCPTPAYDGPDRNAERNVNYSNPSSSFPQPPLAGKKQ